MKLSFSLLALSLFLFTSCNLKKPVAPQSIGETPEYIYTYSSDFVSKMNIARLATMPNTFYNGLNATYDSLFMDTIPVGLDSSMFSFSLLSSPILKKVLAKSLITNEISSVLLQDQIRNTTKIYPDSIFMLGYDSVLLLDSNILKIYSSNSAKTEQYNFYIKIDSSLGEFDTLASVIDSLIRLDVNNSDTLISVYPIIDSEIVKIVIQFPYLGDTLLLATTWEVSKVNNSIIYDGIKDYKELRFDAADTIYYRSVNPISESVISSNLLVGDSIIIFLNRDTLKKVIYTQHYTDQNSSANFGDSILHFSEKVFYLDSSTIENEINILGDTYSIKRFKLSSNYNITDTVSYDYNGSYYKLKDIYYNALYFGSSYANDTLSIKSEYLSSDLFVDDSGHFYIRYIYDFGKLSRFSSNRPILKNYYDIDSMELVVNFKYDTSGIESNLLYSDIWRTMYMGSESPIHWQSEKLSIDTVEAVFIPITQNPTSWRYTKETYYKDYLPDTVNISTASYVFADIYAKEDSAVSYLENNNRIKYKRTKYYTGVFKEYDAPAFIYTAFDTLGIDGTRNGSFVGMSGIETRNSGIYNKDFIKFTDIISKDTIITVCSLSVGSEYSAVSKFKYSQVGVDTLLLISVEEKNNQQILVINKNSKLDTMFIDINSLLVDTITFGDSDSLLLRIQNDRGLLEGELLSFTGSVDTLINRDTTVFISGIVDPTGKGYAKILSADNIIYNILIDLENSSTLEGEVLSNE